MKGPMQFAEDICKQCPDAEYLANLFYELSRELNASQEIISAVEAVADVAYEEYAATQIREADLDAAAAAESDERYSRIKDDEGGME